MHNFEQEWEISTLLEKKAYSSDQKQQHRVITQDGN